MNYFAYGSNMLLPRLRQRSPCAQLLGIAHLPGHVLRFHKAGMDNSGKCDAFFTGLVSDRVIGVLFEISVNGKELLDRIEGLGFGYEEKLVRVVDAVGEEVEAFTYYATAIDMGRAPFHWYKQHVLIGAREAGLPREYIEAIERVDAVEDSNSARASRELGIYLRD
jgi:hypothetical protein